MTPKMQLDNKDILEKLHFGRELAKHFGFDMMSIPLFCPMFWLVLTDVGGDIFAGTWNGGNLGACQGGHQGRGAATDQILGELDNIWKHWKFRFWAVRNISLFKS